MPIFVRKRTNRDMPYLFPVGDGQREKMAKLPDDSTYEITVTKHRSVRENAAWHSFITFLYNDTPVGNDFNSLETLKRYIQVSIGACDVIEARGKVIFIPHSKKFSEMTQEVFHSKIMQPTIDFIFKEYNINYSDWLENRDFIA